MSTIRLRPATADDAALLLNWRNDPSTRSSSFETGEVQKREHISWLTSVLADKDRQLLIAEENGVPVGTVRADLCDGVYELSWTVAPDARGRGVGKRIIMLVASQISEPIRAKVKSDNIASVRIAKHAGMVFEREVTGILYYTRIARKQ